MMRRQSTTVPGVALGSVAVIDRARSDAANAATSPASSSVAGRSSIAWPVMADDRSRMSEIGDRLGTPAGLNAQHADAMGSRSDARMRDIASSAENATRKTPK